MSKKKHNHSDSSFKNDPFKSVKGFSVSKPDVVPPVVKKIVEERPPEPIPCEEHEVDFNQAMSQLGVASLPGDVVAPRTGDFTEDDMDECSSHPKELENSDEALFLANLGQFDTVFEDNFEDDDGPSMVAEPRRMKQLRSGKIRPQDTLDLHGCYRDEARKKVRYFLQHRYAEGLHTLLIVTGRGNRSPGGESVLRSDIEDYLRTRASAWVAEWGRAPRQYGGDGALVVFLRCSK